MPVSRNQDLAVISNEHWTLEYSTDDGSTFVNLPGVRSWSYTGSETPVRDIIPAAGSVGKRPGRPRVGQLTVEAYILPQMEAWDRLHQAQQDGEVLRFRLDTKAAIEFQTWNTNGAQASISTSRVVTFTAGAGQTGQAVPSITGDSFGPGSVIRIGTNNYTIAEITDADVITVEETIGSLVSAANFTIYSPPGTRRVFNGYITQGADITLDEESEASTSLVIQPRRMWPRPTVLTPAA